MSELTTIARPYAKAGFDFAVEQSATEKSAVKKGAEQQNFLGEVVKKEAIKDFLSISLRANNWEDNFFLNPTDPADPTKPGEP
ncbi:hypothetical protein ACEE49_11285, partial [[Pasteurella] aerogenes]